MAGRIQIDAERCKGCGLCIIVCPNEGLAVSGQSNKKGYFPAEIISLDCSGCTSCALICPEAAIEVYYEKRILELKPDKKTKTSLSEEKA